MRNWLIGFGVAAMAAGVSAQDSSWKYFEPESGPVQAGVVAADGSQLILKCDKPGKGAVYAVMVSTAQLVPPQRDGFTMRPIELRFDAEAPVDERWRFYEQSAVAIDKGSERTLTRFLADLTDATKVRLRLNPERGRWVEAEFDVAGAHEAIARVYESCKDQVPTS